MTNACSLTSILYDVLTMDFLRMRGGVFGAHTSGAHLDSLFPKEVIQDEKLIES
jgi:hypothetical protein